MLLPGGGCVAVQRIPSSDLAVFVNRAVDGMLPSPADLRNIRDETFPVSRDESGDKANLRDRSSIQPPTDEENSTREPPDDLRTLWIEYDAHGDRHRAWRDFTRETTFEIHEDWPFDDGRSAPYMVKHFEQTRWGRFELVGKLVATKRDYEHERTLIEMRCFITCLHLSGKKVRPAQA